MGHKHSREQILAGAYAEALEHGLSRLTFGSVARRLGTSDRIVVYYLPSKDDLVVQVLHAAGAELQAVLGATTGTADGHRTLLRMMWSHVARPEVDAVMGLYFEAMGLASGGVEPYRSVARELVEGWTTWVAEHLDVPPAVARDEAEACVALLDGLLLMRRLAGPEAADRAAVRLWSEVS